MILGTLLRFNGYLLDGAGKLERHFVGWRDRIAPVLTHIETLIKRVDERHRFRDPTFARFLAIDRQRARASLAHTAAVVGEVETNRALALWQSFAGDDRVSFQTEVAEVEDRLTILNRERVAAGLVAHGIHEFNEAGLVPPVIEHIWDRNHILDEKSAQGGLLKALFDYNGNPSLTEFIAYIAYFGLIWFGIQKFYSPVREIQKS